MMEETTLQAGPAFDISAGYLCLDFANTISDRLEETPREKLKSYRDLLAWSQQAHILTDEEAQRLLEEARNRSDEAAGLLWCAIELREIIYRIFAAIIEDAVPAQKDMAGLNVALSEAMSHARIVRQEDHYVWDWNIPPGTLDHVLWMVVRSAADLLTSEEVHGAKMCAADDCAWLFLDTSKNQSRRWCDMKTCGNRAKVRRHNTRKKQDASA